MQSREFGIMTEGSHRDPGLVAHAVAAAGRLADAARGDRALWRVSPADLPPLAPPTGAGTRNDDRADLARPVALLFSGVPIFAGLSIFGGPCCCLGQGGLGSVTEVIFGELNRYLLVAIPLFAFMAQ